MSLGIASAAGGAVGDAAGSVVNKVLAVALGVCIFIIIAAGSLAYVQFKNMERTITRLTEANATLQTAVNQAEQINSSLLEQLKTATEIASNSEAVVSEYMKQVEDLQQKVGELEKLLPATLAEADLPKQTQAQKNNAATRIAALWSVYCLDNKTSKECVK